MEEQDSKMLVVKNNTMSNVTYGVHLDMGGSSPAKTLSSLVRDGVVASGDTSAAHGMVPGEGARISNASPAAYNGEWVVSEVPSSTSFKYNMPSDPGSDASSAKFGKIWQLSNFYYTKILKILMPSYKYKNG